MWLLSKVLLSTRVCCSLCNFDKPTKWQTWKNRVHTSNFALNWKKIIWKLCKCWKWFWRVDSGKNTSFWVVFPSSEAMWPLLRTAVAWLCPLTSKTDENMCCLKENVLKNKRIATCEFATKWKFHLGHFRASWKGVRTCVGLLWGLCPLPIHPALSVRVFLTQNEINVVPHPPPSQYISSCYFFLFPKIRMVLYGRRVVAEQLMHESDLSLPPNFKFRILGALPPPQWQFYTIAFRKRGNLFSMKRRL